MDNLKVINPTSIDLGDTFGILNDRLIAISQGMDHMMRLAESGKIKLVYKIDVINYIRSLCETEEEFIWAYDNHIIWLAKTGRIFTTKEAQDFAIKQFGEPEKFQP